MEPPTTPVPRLPARLWALYRNFGELLLLDPSGRYVVQRLITTYRTINSGKIRVIRLAFPLGTRRFRVAAAALIALVRLGKPSTVSHVADVAAVSASDHPLVFTRPATPRVAVVIPVHNNWRLTEDCLRSLLLAGDTTPARVIVVDDASSDETPVRLASVQGIDVVRLDENVGFLRAVHAGVATVSEELVVLLNNDTVVTAGWLDALVDCVDEAPDAGVVGSMLLYPNGVLQEAGGVIFNDASGLNVGKGESPRTTWYWHRREVDYCSGASLLLRRAVWEATGGFDLAFAPAYYEETDFCFNARAHGWRVYYEPRSRVYHLEGGSYGSDDSPRKQALMATNRRKFQEKWATALATQYAPDTSNHVAAMTRSDAGHLVIVDSNLPEYDRDSGSIRMMGVLDILQNLGFSITFLSMRTPDFEPYASTLRRRGVEVIDARFIAPFAIERVGPHAVAAWLCRPEDAEKTEPLMRRFAPQAKIIFDTVDLHYVREARRAELEQSEEIAALAAQYKVRELGLLERCDATLVVTEPERATLLRERPDARVAVVSNIHEAFAAPADFASRNGILFVGNYNHLPNRDAVAWFVDEIQPRLTGPARDATFSIVGSRFPDELQRLAGPRVDVVGWVQDLAPLYRATKLVVAPLRYGAGIKGKVGEAAAWGVPFVATSTATEGTQLADGVDCGLADDAAGFAARVSAIYADEAEWTRLARAGQATMMEATAPARAEAVLRDLFAALGVTVRPKNAA